MKCKSRPEQLQQSRCFWPPWFDGAESARLRLVPVQDRDSLRRAFDLVTIPSIATGMEFPSNLTWAQFEGKYHRQPRKDLFLLKLKDPDKWVGIVILWPVTDRKHWHQILYGIRPEYRGQGLALEGCKVILGLMARHGISEGVAAIVKESNLASEKVVRGLEMVRHTQSARAWWERRLAPGPEVP